MIQQQPYRRGAREPGPALDAMRRGRTASGFNPMDYKRNLQKLMSRPRRASGRPPRPPRPDRPPRGY